MMRNIKKEEIGSELTLVEASKMDPGDEV